MYNLTYIDSINGKLPIRCDNLVLMNIQKTYGTINAFELKLTGLEPKLDKDGNPVFNESGKKEYTLCEPSLETVNYALTLMVNEGLEIEAEMNHMEPRRMTDNEIIRSITMPYMALAGELHKEFSRCFETKK